MVGRPTFPAGTSVATTNVNDRLINAVQCCFAQIGAPHGLAEGGGNFSAGLGVVSGIDDRDGEAVPYVNQFCTGLSGGPGTHGHDGWLTYEAPDGGGVLVLASIEIDEAQYPILMEERRIACDTMGAGRWNGAPATEGAYRSLAGPVSVFYCSDGDMNPAQGVLGGGAGAPSLNRKRGGQRHIRDAALLPRGAAFSPGEAIHYRTVAGGGYGDPPIATGPGPDRRRRRPRLAQHRARAQRLQGGAGPCRQRHRHRGGRGEDAPAPRCRLRECRQTRFLPICAPDGSWR